MCRWRLMKTLASIIILLLLLFVQMITSLLHESAKISEAVGNHLEVEMSRTADLKRQMKALHSLLIFTVKTKPSVKTSHSRNSAPLIFISPEGSYLPRAK